MSAINGSSGPSNIGKVITGFVTGKKDLESIASGKLTTALASVMNKLPRFTDKAQTGDNSNSYRFANAAWGASVAVGGTALCVVCPVIIPVVAAGYLINSKFKEASETKGGQQTDLSKLTNEQFSKLTDKQLSKLTADDIRNLSPEQKRGLDLTKLSKMTLEILSDPAVHTSDHNLEKSFTAPQLEKLLNHLEQKIGVVLNKETGKEERRVLDPNNKEDMAYITKARLRKNNPDQEQLVFEEHPYMATMKGHVTIEIENAIGRIKDAEAKQPADKAEEPAHTPSAEGPFGARPPPPPTLEKEEPAHTPAQAKTEEPVNVEHAPIDEGPKLPTTLHELDMKQVTPEQYKQIKDNLSEAQIYTYTEHKMDVDLGQVTQGPTYPQELIDHLHSQVPQQAQAAEKTEAAEHAQAPRKTQESNPFHELDVTKLTDNQYAEVADKLTSKQKDDYTNHTFAVALGDKEATPAHENYTDDFISKLHS